MNYLQRFLSPVLCTVLLTAAGAARADVMTGSTVAGDSFNLYIVTSPDSSGVSYIDSVAGTITVQGVTFSVDAMIPTSAPGVTTYTADGYFYFDNLLYTGGGNYFDSPGLAFSLTDGTEVNLFYNDDTAGSGFLYENNGYNSSIAQMQVAPTPEPSGLLLLGSGVAGLAEVMRRRRQ